MGRIANWSEVNRSVNKARQQLISASSEEQFQAVGLICREALISLAQVVYDPTLHLSADNINPSETDAKRMLEGYIQHKLEGRENEITRKYAKAALDLANELQHKRTAEFRDAALCIEATKAVIRFIGVISGFVLSELKSPLDKVKEMMHELITEIKSDLARDKFVREFYVASKRWAMTGPANSFIYYFEEHENLQGKVQVLENYGFVTDVTTGNLKKYRMTEEFIESILYT